MIDPNVMKTAVKPAAQRNAAGMNAQRQNAVNRVGTTAAKQPGLVKPGVAKQPSLVNKKPVLAPGSVRANAARESLANRDMDLQRQAAMPPPGLDIAPIQLPFNAPPQDMQNIPPDMTPPPGMLDLAPTQLPFNPNSGIAGMNPDIAGIPPGVNPRPMNPGIGADPRIMVAQQNRLLNQRQNAGLAMDRNRAAMAMNRLRGGY